MANAVWILSIIVTVVVGGLLLLWGKHCSSTWRGPSKSGARLPKGSFGWPVIGETFDFARDPFIFASSHVKRYGKIFKTSLRGQKMILGLTPEFSKFITSNRKLFTSGYSPYLMKLIGPKGLMFLDGSLHMSMKKIVQKPVLPEALRTQVNVLETIVLENMASWEQNGTIIGKDATAKITMDTGLWLVLGLRDIGSTPEGKKLMENLKLVNNALNSVQVNLPGTDYNKGLEAKAALNEYFKYLIDKRKGQENPQADLLGVLLAAHKDTKVREEVKDFDLDMIADNLLFFWLAAYGTTASALTWVLKLLVDNPEVFRRIQDEQQEILDSKEKSAIAPRLSWEDTRKMVYTQKFYQEVLRTVSVSYIVLKNATQDIEYEGHLIPKGWRVGWMQNFIHSDPDVFTEPDRFNPDRFDEAMPPNAYLPFASGVHMCPGIEFSKLTALILIHHLTTSYVYESAGPWKGVEYNSFKIPKGGYPINIRRRI